MNPTVKLKPGQKGTKALLTKYGDALLCVRYRYDVHNCTRIKTVELVIEKKPWTPPLQHLKDDTLVNVRIGYGDKDLREKAKTAQGRWDPKTRVWHIQFGKVKGTELEKFIIS